MLSPWSAFGKKILCINDKSYCKSDTSKVGLNMTMKVIKRIITGTATNNDHVLSTSYSTGIHIFGTHD